MLGRFLISGHIAIMEILIKDKTMLNQEFIEEMKAKLLSEKERFTTELSGLSAHTEVGEDFDENATEVQMDDLNSDLRNRMEGDLAKIEKALAKIDDGTYGTDDEGKEISEERLRVIPWADQAI
jgi:RNA polymerase-binding transcription factor DksA